MGNRRPHRDRSASVGLASRGSNASVGASHASSLGPSVDCYLGHRLPVLAHGLDALDDLPRPPRLSGDAGLGLARILALRTTAQHRILGAHGTGFRTGLPLPSPRDHLFLGTIAWLR